MLCVLYTEATQSVQWSLPPWKIWTSSKWWPLATPTASRECLCQVHTALTKTEEKQKWNYRPHIRQNVNIFCVFQCFVLSTVSGQRQWSAYIIWASKKTEKCGHTSGCDWLYIPRIKNIKWKKKSKRRVWVMPVLSKRKILTYTSLLSWCFELSNPCPRHTANGPQCAENSL